MLTLTQERLERINIARLLFMSDQRVEHLFMLDELRSEGMRLLVEHAEPLSKLLER